MFAKTKDPSSHIRGNQYEGQTTFRFNPFPLPAISVVTTRNLRPHLCISCRQKTKTGWAAGSGYLTDQIQNKCRRPLNIKHAVLFDICLFFCHIFPDDALCRLFKSTSGGSQAVGLLTRSLSTTMGSPTTLWLVIFSWEKRLQPPISRSTAAPSCPHPCSCTWWSQSSPSPRSSNMSTTSSPGERSLAIELSITNWIYPKKGGHDKLVDRLIVSGCLMCRAPVGRLSLLPSAMDGAAKSDFHTGFSGLSSVPHCCRFNANNQLDGFFSFFTTIRMAGGQNVGFQNSTFLSER